MTHTMNHTTIALDFLLQAIEAGVDPDEARDSTVHTLYKYREVMTRDSYTQTIDLINRVAKLAKGGRNA